VERQDLPGVQPRLVPEELGEVPDPSPGGAIAERCAEDATGARGRSGEAEQQLDGRRLAGAVWPEQADEFAPPDGQAQPGERGRPAVRLDDAVELDHRV